MNGEHAMQGSWTDERVRGLKLVLRCDAAPDIGLGHLQRCLALAGWLETKPVFVLLHASDAAKDLIRAAGYQAIAASSLEARMQAIREARPDAIVLDIAHAASRRSPAEVSKEIEALQELAVPLIFIDGNDTDAMADQTLASKVSLCVRPYAGAKAGTENAWLTGAEYFIVAPDALKAAAVSRRDARKPAHRLLITTGGGDVGALGPRILQELNAAREPHFDIRVIVGPLVSTETKRATEKAASAGPHNVEIYDNRNGLTADMQWADMAVATTGLTKYELALNAVPSILISPDEQHEMNHRSFRECDTALNLGAAGSLPRGAIREACVRLAQDAALRERLSARSGALIDGKGALRFLAAVKSLSDARQ